MAMVPSWRVWALFSVKSMPRLPAGIRATSQLAKIAIRISAAMASAGRGVLAGGG